MISREQVALVYNYAREQAHLREELQELGNQALLRRLDVPERTVAESHMCSWLTRRRCTFPLDNPTAVSSDEQFVHIQSPAALHREPEVLLPALGIASAPVTDNQLEDLPSQNPPDDESITVNGVYLDDQESDQDSDLSTAELNSLQPSISANAKPDS